MKKTRKYNQLLYRPLHILFLFFTFLYQDSHDSSDYMKYFYLGGVLFLINFLKIIRLLKRISKDERYVIVYLAFVVYATIALFYGVSIQIPAYKLFIFGTAMFLVYWSEFDNESKIIDFMNDFWIGSFLMCLHFIFNTTTGLNGRTQVLGMNVINAGIVASLAILFCIYLYNETKKLFYLIQIPVAIYVILLSGSKSALLAAAILVVLYTVYFLNSLSHKIAAILIFFIVLMVSYRAILNIDYLYNTMGYRLEGFQQTLSGEAGGEDESRIIMINDAFNFFKNNPLLGLGFDCYRVESRWTETWSHCNYAEILSCFGVVGFIIYYLRYIYILIALRNNHKKQFIALCYSIVTCILVIDIMIVNYYTALYQIIFALLCAACTNKLNKSELKPQDERKI